MSTFLRRLRGQAIAICALCVALGGTSYAAVTITGKQVKNSSLTGSDIKNHSLTAREFKRGTLLRGSRGATGLTGPAGQRGPQGASGTAADAAKVKCPTGTDPVGGACVETTARPAADYNAASITCGSRGLPNVSQLISYVSSHPGQTGTEWSSDILALGAAPSIAVVDVSNGLATESTNTPHPFRCVTTPAN
jgi:hypothetical protein